MFLAGQKAYLKLKFALHGPDVAPPRPALLAAFSPVSLRLKVGHIFTLVELGAILLMKYNCFFCARFSIFIGLMKLTPPPGSISPTKG